MAEPLKIAIAGYGTMGRIYAKAINRMKDGVLAAVWARDALKIEGQGEIGAARVFESYNEMLHSGEVDVVCLTLPTYLHKEYAIKAAMCGKHVICEKPIALNVLDATEMIDCFSKHGTRLFVGHVVRFFPEYVDIKRLFDEGIAGQAGVAHASRVSVHPAEKSWYSDPAKSGGLFLDLMIHDIDLLRWILGEVRSVFAVRRLREGLDYAAATLRFESGAIAHVRSMWGYPGPFTTSLEIAGTEGVLRQDSRTSKALSIAKPAREWSKDRGVVVPSVPAFDNPFDAQLARFVDCIRTGEEPRVSDADAKRAVMIAEAARYSSENGVAVDFIEDAAYPRGGERRG